MKLIGRVLLFIFMAALVWIPLYFLSHLLGLLETPVLVASLATLAILLLIFFPGAREVLKRISKIRIAGVELDLRSVISESIETYPEQFVFVGLDERVTYDKADVNKFVRFVQSQMGRPLTRIVLTVNLMDPSRIDVPMLYFQVSHLLELFDLRAILFTNGSKTQGKSGIIGTISPRAALSLLDERAELRRAYSVSLARYREMPLPEHPDNGILNLWRMYSDAIANSDRRRRLTLDFVHSRFGPHLEANFVNYPLKPKEFPSLLSFALGGKDHVIILEEGRFRSVRTIDRLARDIMIRLLEVSLSRNEDGRAVEGET
jgi:hypothetical protein